jgi:RND family efflux transporter MFP subunit
MRTPTVQSIYVLCSLLGLLVAGSTLSACHKAEAPKPPEPVKAIHVDTAQVTEVEAPKTLRLTGTLHGARETELAANISGRVSKTFVERGMAVEKGAVIANVDVSSAMLTLAEARVQVAQSETQEQISRAECERYEKMRDVTTALAYEQIAAKCKTAPLTVEAAKARQSIAQKTVGDGVVRAPFAGVIAERYVDEGEYVLPSSKIVAIAQIDELRLEFSLPEAHWPDLKVGADVSFRVIAYGETVFHGTVDHVAGSARETRDVLVDAKVINTDRKLLPGMFADVEVTLGKQKLPAVPRSAVFAQNGKQNVFVVKDGQLEQRVLQPLDEVAGRVPVLRGVALGEQVVGQYASNLSNGQAVN